LRRDIGPAGHIAFRPVHIIDGAGESINIMKRDFPVQIGRNEVGKVLLSKNGRIFDSNVLYDEGQRCGMLLFLRRRNVQFGWLTSGLLLNWISMAA
jgi:hypothetical protein